MYEESEVLSELWQSYGVQPIFDLTSQAIFTFFMRKKIHLTNMNVEKIDDDTVLVTCDTYRSVTSCHYSNSFREKDSPSFARYSPLSAK